MTSRTKYIKLLKEYKRLSNRYHSTLEGYAGVRTVLRKLGEIRKEWTESPTSAEKS